MGSVCLQSRVRSAVLGAVMLAAAIANAAITPYDFTGTWTGSATGKKGAVDITFSLSGTGPVFTGSFSATVQGGTLQCTVAGKQRPHSKVKMRLTQCNDNSTIVLHGKLNPAAVSGPTIAGRYVRIHKGKVQAGSFTLTRMP